MKKIFAYTKEAKLSRKILASLEDAGYIPVPVEHFNCVRLIEPIPDATIGAVMTAALKAIQNDKGFDPKVKTDFANKLLTALLDETAGEPKGIDAGG